MGSIKFKDELTGSFETRYEVDRFETKLFQRTYMWDLGVNEGRNGSSVSLSSSLSSRSSDALK